MEVSEKVKVKQLALEGGGPDCWTPEQMLRHTADQISSGEIDEKYSCALVILVSEDLEIAKVRLSKLSILKGGMVCDYMRRRLYQSWECD